MGQKALNRVTILGMPNTLPTTLTGPLDVFTQAGQLWQLLCEGMPSPLFTVELVSPAGDEIRCMNGFGIKPHRSMSEVTSTDLIIITAADVSDRRPWHKAKNPCPASGPAPSSLKYLGKIIKKTIKSGIYTTSVQPSKQVSMKNFRFMH